MKNVHVDMFPVSCTRVSAKDRALGDAECVGCFIHKNKCGIDTYYFVWQY
jgi:hypothetical protein